MNNTRRNQIAAAMAQLEILQGIVEAIQEAEQEAFDNLPEGIQASERGEAMEEAVSNLESAIDSIQEALDYMEAASA